MLIGQTSEVKHLTRQQKVSDPALANSTSKPLQSQLQAKQISQEGPPRPCLWFVISVVIFVLAVAVYGGIWAISKYLVTVQTSYYYNKKHVVSPYIYASGLSTCDSAITIFDSTTLYEKGKTSKPTAVALYLVFSWLMWKLPIALFMLHLIFEATNRILKYVSWAVALLIMLTVDILLTIFVWNYYQQYMFYAFASVLTIIVSMINNRINIKSAFMAGFLPLFYIALLYFSYTYFIPALYNVFVKHVIQGYPYLMIYGYPVLDLIFYAGLLAINARGPQIAKPCLSFIQFFLLGYIVGITMLVSITQVQFYFLCGYMLFRNFFTNWVMWKWETVVNNPPCLPGWGIVYYLSYIANFLPLIGLGPLVVSLSFNSQQFSQSCILLYPFPNTQYQYDTTPKLLNGFNYRFIGFIFWPAALIIWGISTMSQKYSRRKPTFFDFFYNMAGIYMFYIGISAGLQLLTLRQIQWWSR